jgi:predicted dehydrogenase
MPTPRKYSRRRFLQSTAATSAAYWLTPRGAWAQSNPPAGTPGDALNVAVVGVSGRGLANIDELLKETKESKAARVVALCDVDERNFAKPLQLCPGAKTFQDFRVMLDTMPKDIDAVLVATPDHTHAVCAVTAMKHGKHVYCEKPLAHDVHEVRVMQQTAREHKLCTQMGTQIHARPNYRRSVEIIQAGIIGPVREVHVWSNTNWKWDAKPRPGEAPPSLDYDLWLGPAPYRRYSPSYVPFYWRWYWNFGNGSLGDMGCHYIDLPFWALGLTYPTKVSAEGPPVDAEVCPLWQIARWQFPERGGQPAVSLNWYCGGKLPEKFEEWGLDPKWKAGVLFVGDKGQLYCDYELHRLFPRDEYKDFQAPPKTIPDSIGHHAEWVQACRNNDPGAPLCRFDYSGRVAETVLLGTAAYRAGTELEWDAHTAKVTNTRAADAYLKREYRKGWSL